MEHIAVTFGCTVMAQGIPQETCVTARRCSTSSQQPISLPMQCSIFGELKKDIRGHCFTSEKDVLLGTELFWQTAHKLFKNRTDGLVLRWNKCINSVGDYFWGNKCSITRFGIWLVFIWLSLISTLRSRWIKWQGAWLRAGWPGLEPRCWRSGDFSSLLRVQTGPGVHSTSYKTIKWALENSPGGGGGKGDQA